MAKKIHIPKLCPFPLYFKPTLSGKLTFQRQHLPCEFRANLIVYGIIRTGGMKTATELILNHKLDSLAPPSREGGNGGTWEPSQVTRK